MAIPALQKQLVTAPAEGFFDLPFVGVDVGDIGIRMARDPIEVAKFAIRDANIGRIHIAIDLPGDLSMRNLLFPQLVCDIHQFGQRGLFEKKDPLLRAEELNIQCPFV